MSEFLGRRAQLTEGGAPPVRIGQFKLPYFLAVVLGALAYFAAAELGLQLTTLQENASPIWPASGIALALVMTGGPRMAYAVFIGAFAANALEGTALPVVMAMAAGNTIEALLARTILQSIAARRSDNFFFAETIGYFAAALAAPIASASFGVFSMALNHSFPAADIAPIWFTWWMGDAVGIVLVTPVLIATSRRFILKAWLRFVALGLVTAALTAVAMTITGAGAMLFLLLAVTLVATRAAGRVSARGIILIMAAITVAFTSAHIGPFADASVNQSLLKLGLFLATIAFAGMIISDLAERLSRWPIAIFMFGCAAASIAFTASEASRLRSIEQHFDQLIQSATTAVRDRMGGYVDILRGGAGLFAASTSVTPVEWRSYVDSIDLQQRYPGLSGMGLVLPVAAKDFEKFAANSDFTIRPLPGFEIDPEKDHAIVVMVEPMRTNAPALGIDNASEPTRFDAAEIARRHNQPVISGTITLVQDETQSAGFILYVPMYRKAAGRNNTFQGWIYAPIIARQFFPQALREELSELDVRIYDESGTLVFESVGAQPADRLEAARQIELYGRQFTLSWRSNAAFNNDPGLESAFYAAAAIVIATLLAALTANLQSVGQRATSELARANKRLNLILNGSKDGIWHWDLVQDKCWFSDRFKEILGYRPDEFDNRLEFLLGCIVPEERAAASQQFSDLAAGKIDAIDVVRRYLHKNGHLVTLHGRVTSELDDAGNVVTIAGAVTDITELQRAEQRLKDAIGSLHVGFALFDADDRVVICNDAFLDPKVREVIGNPVGRPFEELVRASANIIDPEKSGLDREAWVAARMEKHRNPPETPIEITFSTGRIVQVSERRTSDGGYVGTWTDITDVKKIETRLENAIESINEGFALFDKELKFVLFNQRLLEMYKISAPAIRIGASLEDVLRYGASHGEYPEIETEADADRIIPLWLDAFRKGQAFIHEGQFARGHWALQSHRPTADGGFVSIHADITAQIMREQELRDVRDRLEQQASELVCLSESLDLARRGAEAANREKSQFLAHMSHELRTPLNAILGFSEMMMKELLGPIQNDTYKNYVALINSSGTHLLSLINDVLDISKIEAGKRELNITSLSSAELARQSKGLVESLAKERGVKLEAKASEQCPIVQGDERALRQILLNLLSNAIKFTPANGEVSLRIEPSGDNETAVIVSDTGIGMSEDEVRIAMQPYGQIDSTIARQTEGTGLGLPLTKALTELHGGRLKMESRKGRGTTVTVTLPLCA